MTIYFLTVVAVTAIICTGIICYARGYRAGVAHCTVQLAVLEDEMRQVNKRIIEQLGEENEPA